MNEATLMDFVQKTAGLIVGATVCAGIQLGDRLGLYAALATGPQTADELASDTGCNARLIREWLDGQAAAGLVDFDADQDTYLLSPEGVMVLADPTSPVFLARGVQGASSVYIDMDKLAEAYQSDGAMAWGDHHECLFKGTEWFFRPGYRAHLTAEWIPALDGVADKLQAGARVADVGCGHGASLAVMAQAYPESTFTGIDYHGPSVDTARTRMEEAGVSERCDFQTADAQGYDGTYDLICFFDCLHDMGDPVGAARYAREHLSPGGTVLLVEPFAIDGRSANIDANPFAPMLYHASAMICTPNSLSQDVGLGLGAQAGEERLREVITEAGFSDLSRRAETPFNLVLQASP
ncbi:MAG: class I SAM-dependent methyltransferase [Actinomycetota bacterium]